MWHKLEKYCKLELKQALTMSVISAWFKALIHTGEEA